MIRQILISVCIGLLATLWYLQHDPWTQERIGSAVLQSMGKAFEGTVTGRVRSLNLFQPSIEFENAYASSQGTQWSWSAERFVIACSWLDIIFKRVAHLHIEIHHGRGNSSWHDTSLGLSDFVEALRTSFNNKVPILLRSLLIEHGQICLCDVEKKRKVCLSASTELKRNDTALKATINLQDIALICDGHYYAQQGDSKILLHTTSATADQTKLHYSIEGSCLVHTPTPVLYVIKGNFDEQGTIVMRSVDDQCVVAVDQFSYHDGRASCDVAAHVPLATLGYFANNETLQQLGGEAKLQAYCTKSATDYALSTTLTISDLIMHNYLIADSLVVTSEIKSDEASGTVSMTRSHTPFFAGTWYATLPELQVHLDLHNSSSISSLSGDAWHLLPNNAQVIIDACPRDVILTYSAILKNGSDDRIAHLSGIGACANNNIVLDGTYENVRYYAVGKYAPHPHITSCSVKDVHHNYFGLISSLHEPNKFHATIDGAFMRWLLNLSGTTMMQIDGDAELDVLLREKIIYGALNMSHAALRMPHVHNVIQGLFARFAIDVQRKNVEFRDIKGLFHRGSLTCDRATLLFNDDLTLHFVHIPVLLNNCFINWTRDFFAVISGSLLYTQRGQEQPYLKGELLIDRAQLKYNIFSSQLSRDMFSTTRSLFNNEHYDMLWDVNLKTKDPVRIKTNFLETHAKLSVHLDGSVCHPRVTGNIDFLSGEFNFPYKPLHITKGTLQFTHQTDDPIIQVLAKNRIKQYQVNLHISGTLQHPHVVLEASPTLTEEQIIGLLLAGSESDSLSLVIPALLANNLKNLIFSSDQSFSLMDRYVQRLLKPLRYIHVVPSYNDQTARGDVRGGLEVEITDQLRAYLQKNFTLTEDTRFEVDYLLSDDIRLKAVRDEHGDTSAEMEVRWKF